MTTKKPFAQAGFLDYLQCVEESTSAIVDAPISPLLSSMLLASNGTIALTKTGEHLILVLKARRAMLQAAFDTELAADELRRYQKFVKPGQPSPHIVGLRQKQGAARQAGSVARQSFVKAAAAFVREAGIDVPQRVALDAFIDGWIEANVPKDASPSI